MKKILVAVDDSRGSEDAVNAFLESFACWDSGSVVLLYVEKIEGRSLMDEMLGKAELSTLKEELQGTEHQERLDRKARAVLGHFSKKFEDKGVKEVKSIVRVGHPADEILEAAREEGAGLIMVGSRGRRLHTLLMGSVSREVANRSDVPVLLAK